jgi:hypothetical protein
MARLIDNILLYGLSGKIGDIVVKKYGDKYVISKVPDMSKVVFSKLQKDSQNNFAKASAWAKGVTRIDSIRQLYLKKNNNAHSAYNMAIRDFQTPPEIQQFELIPESSLVKITATDDFVVTKVELTFLDETGKVIEYGEARYKIDWNYIFHCNLQKVAQIRVIVWDFPGNIAEATFSICQDQPELIAPPEPQE